MNQNAAEKCGSRISEPAHDNVEAPSGYNLSQNFPDPFNPTTRIEYTLPKRGYVALTVYDILGERVATLLSGEQGSGKHVLTLDASGYASGFYFYRLYAEGFFVTRRMHVSK